VVKRERLASASAVLALFFCALPAEPASLELSFATLERIIVRNVMTEGGRYYMQGTPSTPCQYAFVQEPRVSSAAGRLRITLLFSGRAGVEIAGRCVGGGDNFDVLVSGVPRFANGEIYLAELELEASSGFFNAVAGLIRASLEEKLRFSVKQAMDYVAEQTAASGMGRLAVDDLRVDDIRVGASELWLRLDFSAVLRP
jgi:hypothetical protein